MTSINPLLPQDVAAVAAMRQATSAHKGHSLGPEARPMFDAMLGAVPPVAGGRVEDATIGGIPGVRLRPDGARPDARLLYIHGGGYVLGSAGAFTNFAGQIAARVGVEMFIPDYRLAPEHPFPAAIDDVLAAYRGLVAEGGGQIAVAGDSAGGGLTLALLSILTTAKGKGLPPPVGAAVMSPWTDLALTGASMETRAEADPIFMRDMLEAFAALYLQGRDAADPEASPLYGRLEGLPPIRIDVGDDEILLDDSTRYAAWARTAGVDVTLAIWERMPHVFQSSLGRFLTAEHAVNAMSEFLYRQLSGAALPNADLSGA